MHATQRTIRRALCALLLALLLAGCAEPVVTPTLAPTPAPTRTSVSPTATPTLVPPTATPQPTPTPTPRPPLIEISSQTVEDDGIIVVDHVYLDDDGFVALYAGARLLGSAPVSSGDSHDVTITVDPLSLNDVLSARLFYSDPVVDQDAEPVAIDDKDVALNFVIERNISTPQLVVDEQQFAGEDGVITINTLVAIDRGWLAIYSDTNGRLDKPVGLYYIREAGVLRDIPVAVRWRSATPRLHAVLHVDQGEQGLFEPQVDPILRVGTQPLQQSFSVRFPPDVIVVDQPVLENRVVVDRAVSYGEGWLTVFFANADGQPESVVGFAKLQDGVNELIEVELVENARTDLMFVQLHRDTGAADLFEFPAADPPDLYQEQVFSFPFATNQGNYVISADQPLQITDGAATVNVPLVVGDVPIWVAVRADSEGNAGEVLGATWIAPGVNRDVAVEIDADAATDRLHVVLHIDRDTYQLFEYPEGRDFELQRRFAPIDAPFSVLP